MSNEINTKVESVRRFFKENKAANHPITEHPVSEQEEYVRDLYLDMLCVVAQYESVDTENAFTFIKRIMAACEDTQPFDEYIRRSMELTTEKTTEFIMQCKENNLCEIFFVDSLITACANGTPNNKQVSFMAQFGDMLGFDKNKMTAISKFVISILEQDAQKYHDLLTEENRKIQLSVICYAKEYAKNMYRMKINNDDTGKYHHFLSCICSLENYSDCYGYIHLVDITCIWEQLDTHEDKLLFDGLCMAMRSSTSGIYSKTDYLNDIFLIKEALGIEDLNYQRIKNINEDFNKTVSIKYYNISYFDKIIMFVKIVRDIGFLVRVCGFSIRDIVEGEYFNGYFPKDRVLRSLEKIKKMF